MTGPYGAHFRRCAWQAIDRIGLGESRRAAWRSARACQKWKDRTP